MGTMTAQILVGSGHPYHDGISPSHYLFLFENNQPAWVLVKENIFPGNTREIDKITWAPTLKQP
jgi:hypothetical protein